MVSGILGLEEVLGKALEPVFALGAPIAFLVVAVLPGLAEEALFRGSVQPAFGARRPSVGIVVSAVLSASFTSSRSRWSPR
jgi:membrane protease YdiL (CAAX protease family)